MSETLTKGIEFVLTYPRVYIALTSLPLSILYTPAETITTSELLEYCQEICNGNNADDEPYKYYVGYTSQDLFSFTRNGQLALTHGLPSISNDDPVPYIKEIINQLKDLELTVSWSGDPTEPIFVGDINH